MTTPHSLDRLATIMARLRDPDAGCPWDLAQDFTTIAPYTIEEAYEVAEAVRLNDMAELKGELGDLLFQVAFHARMAEEAGHFALGDVVAAICDKMERRHPHVFGDVTAKTPAAVLKNWEAIKAAERAASADPDGPPSALDGVAVALPALMRAEKLQRRAARVGFDWPDAAGPRAKILEELDEIDAATTDAERAEEAGDLLFAVTNYVRKLGLDPEAALRAACDKFEGRFRAMEAMADEFAGRDLAAQEALWQAAKARA